MPYFSFILKENIFEEIIREYGPFDYDIKYYSKNTKLWSKLNKLKKKSNLIILNKEMRESALKEYESILFCLPPNIGLGDAIEYALAIKSIQKENPSKIVGVAHTGKFNSIFINFFRLQKVFDYISEDELLFFDSIFHFTFEIDDLAFQKYDRKNIEKLITDYFNVPLYRKKYLKNNFPKKINTISIFPISQSPLRCLPIYILNSIIDRFVNNYAIEIFLDSNSQISEYIYNNINSKNKLKFHDPQNLDELIANVKDIQFGIFPDSGPLHLAKILNKKGILICSSVSQNILLNKFPSINALESFYESKFCKRSCGLVNVFEYENNSGCYDSLSVSKDSIIKMKNLKNLQRGNLKKNYLKLYVNSINCYKYYNMNTINENIFNNLEKNII